jgi:UDP-2-acetamido-2-deoxy-ribo-hexuluronate aminotransferase
LTGKITPALTDRWWNDHKAEYLAKLDTLVSQNHLFNNTYTALAQQHIKKLTGRQYCVFTPSGTSAIQLALISAGICEGDGVICPNMSYVASANQIGLIGATPQFVDIDRYGHIDVDLIKDSIDETTRAIMPVGLYGDNFDHDGVQDLAKEYNLIVLEDSAQSYGTGYNNKPAGSLGNIGILSFARNKPVCTPFGGGALVTDDAETARIAQLASVNGKNGRYGEIECYGINAQQCEDRALAVCLSFDRLEWYNQRRQQITQSYIDACKQAGVSYRKPRSQSTTNHHKFVLFVDNQDIAINKFAEQGIGAEKYYQDDFEHSLLNKLPPRSMPMTEWYMRSVCCLPTDPYLTDNEVELISSIIQNL